ncbi:MAG: pseudouridine synthase [Saprospiraceae bacterium]|nr:pseudouridine synthase [Saprospiraceae bacterium]
MTYIYYKPFQVLSQFTREAENQRCLADFIKVPANVYPVGRLDYDSEGLLLLTDDKKLNHEYLNPDNHISKLYYVQVEGIITPEALKRLGSGVDIKLPNKSLYTTLPCTAKKINTPAIPQRIPPIRFRANIPDSWLSIEINEGKNRQIRKMCAAVGFPVLRLVRYGFGPYTIKGMKSGDLVKIN